MFVKALVKVQFLVLIWDDRIVPMADTIMLCTSAT